MEYLRSRCLRHRQGHVAASWKLRTLARQAKMCKRRVRLPEVRARRDCVAVHSGVPLAVEVKIPRNQATAFLAYIGVACAACMSKLHTGGEGVAKWESLSWVFSRTVRTL